MVTVDDTPKLKQGGRYEIPFSGMSSDTKPTHVYKGMKIANGSSFFEIDTQDVAFYDEEG